MAKDANFSYLDILRLVSWGVKQLHPGEIWTPRDVRDVPEVTYDADPGAYCTLVNDGMVKAKPLFCRINFFHKE